MIKAFRQSYALRITCRVNSILYAIKHIPVIGKALGDDLYGSRGPKVLGWILAILWELPSVFLGKLLYLFILVFTPVVILADGANGAGYLHVLLFLSLAGAILRRQVMDGNTERYYAVFLMRMDAGAYTLSNHCWKTLKVIVGFLPWSLWLGGILEAPFWACVMAPFGIAGIKLFMDGLCLQKCRKKQDTYSNAPFRPAWLGGVIVVICLVAAYAPLWMGWSLPMVVACAGFVLYILLGVWGLVTSFTFDGYREINMQQFQLQADKENKLADDQTRYIREGISEVEEADESEDMDDSEGFVYLNRLFVRRHKKLLWKPALLVTKIVAVIAVIICGVFLLFGGEESPEELEEMMLQILPCMLFVMYLINRGQNFTRALFMNCDCSLLTYSFFKQPDNVLKLFRIRLVTLLSINLVPSAAVAGGICLVTAVMGGPTNPASYGLVIVSILAMGVFFSIHYLTIYYLLQPYDVSTEVKSVAYSAVTVATYWVCWMGMRLDLSGAGFAIGCIAFSVVYFIVACILVYRLAPSTFRLRI